MSNLFERLFESPEEREYRQAQLELDRLVIQQKTAIIRKQAAHFELLEDMATVTGERPTAGGVAIAEAIGSPINDDGQVWNNVTNSGANKLPPDWNRNTYIKTLRQAKYTRWTVSAIIDNFRKYTIDEGATFTADDDDEEQQDVLDEYAAEYFTEGIQKEYLERLIRDGEVFRYCDGRNPAQFYDPEFFINPEDANDMTKEGIEFDKDGNPVNYYYSLDGGQTMQIIPADNIYHLKNGVDSNEARGVPRITPAIFALCCDLEELEKNRRWLVSARTAIVMQQSIAGGSTAIATVRSRNQTESDPTTKTNKAKKFRPGTIITSSKGVEIDFKSPNVDGSDTEVIARAARLGIAAAVGLPENLLWADASNANYSSTKQASKEQWATVRDLRGALTQAFEWEFEKQIGLTGGDVQKMITKKKPAKVEKPDDLFGRSEVPGFEEVQEPATGKVNVDWPPLDDIDADKQADAITKDLGNRLCSRHTAMIERGYDPEYEESQIEEERAAEMADFDMMAQRGQQEIGGNSQNTQAQGANNNQNGNNQGGDNSDNRAER